MELQFSKEQILEKLMQYIDNIPPKKVKNKEFYIDQLKKITVDDLNIEQRCTRMCKGYVEVNCTAVGFHRNYDDSYVRRTINPVVESTEHHFRVGGDSNGAYYAWRLTGESGYNSYDTSSLDSIAKAVGKNYCTQSMQNLNLELKEFRVNNCKFQATGNPYEFYTWKVSVMLKDSKDREFEYQVGSIVPTSLSQDKQSIEIGFELPKKNSGDPNPHRGLKIFGHVIHTLLLLAAIACSAIAYFTDGMILGLGITVLSLIFFIASKASNHKKVFTVLSLLAIAYSIAANISFVLALL